MISEEKFLVILYNIHYNNYYLLQYFTKCFGYFVHIICRFLELKNSQSIGSKYSNRSSGHRVLFELLNSIAFYGILICSKFVSNSFF